MEFPNRLLERLDNELPSLMRIWNNNEDGADWDSCGFCSATADYIKNVPQEIKHGSDCLGIVLMEALKDKDFS